MLTNTLDILTIIGYLPKTNRMRTLFFATIALLLFSTRQALAQNKTADIEIEWNRSLVKGSIGVN